MTKEKNGFRELGLSQDIVDAVAQKGFTEPTPIQYATIPLLLGNTVDVVGQAQTGTGKTAAFGLPLLDLLQEGEKKVQALVLVPTRELALQVTNELISYKGNKKLFITTVYGGQNIQTQIRDLKKGVDIVVGTPGRIMDHMERGTLRIDNISHLILDEADEMLNMGFVDDIETILAQTPDKKRVLLFSATMPPRILSIAKKYMGAYELIKVTPQTLTTSLTEQRYYAVTARDKREALCRIIDFSNEFYGLVFCQTKIETDEIAHYLIEKGYPAESIHGDISQAQREKTLARFKKKLARVLVATDVAARGIDVKDLTHVVNYSLPQEAETYVHRIGRTGRAGKAGMAVSLVSPSEMRKFSLIKKIANTEIKKSELPSGEQVVSKKMEKLKHDVFQLIGDGETGPFLRFAQELLGGIDPEELVAALLRIHYPNDFSAKKYTTIQEQVARDYDDNDNARQGGKRHRSNKNGVKLFVALGKTDNMSPRRLVDMLEQETRVPQRKIDDVRILDNYSFVTVSPSDARIIIEHYKRKSKKGKRNLVEVAKE
ncbi:MAG: DEAD/DEAH box helicase [Candidatus Competibacteraceae bacterium]|nr:DEAD/DEAH box helicase [Candidatus Competibacteraceae bacterium]